MFATASRLEVLVNHFSGQPDGRWTCKETASILLQASGPWCRSSVQTGPPSDIIIRIHQHRCLVSLTTCNFKPPVTSGALVHTESLVICSEKFLFVLFLSYQMFLATVQLERALHGQSHHL